jgi:hypothetical protein
MFLGRVVGVASKQLPQRRFGERCDVQQRRCRFRRVPRLLAIVIALKADRSANGRVVLGPAFAKFSRGARKIGTKATRFNDGDL